MKKLLLVIPVFLIMVFLFGGRANAVNNEISAMCFIQPISEYYTLTPTPFSQTFKPTHNHLAVIALALYGSGNVDNDNMGHFKLADGAGNVIKENDFVMPNGHFSYNFPLDNAVVSVDQIYTITLSKTAQTKQIGWGFSPYETCYAEGQSSGAPWTGDFIFGAYGYNGDIPPAPLQEELIIPASDPNVNNATSNSTTSTDQGNQKTTSSKTAKDTAAKAVVLPAPTNLKISETGEAYITFSWDKSQNILTGYSLEIKHEGGSGVIIDTINGDANTFTLNLSDSPTLRRNTQYTFSLISRDADGNISAGSNSVTGSFPEKVEVPKAEAKQNNYILIDLGGALLIAIALLSYLIYKRRWSGKHEAASV